MADIQHSIQHHSVEINGIVGKTPTSRGLGERLGYEVVYPSAGSGRLAASGLRELYADRLAGVLLYGSHARGDAGPESDIDLLVILSEMQSPWDELRRMDDLLWQLSFQYGFTVSALPVTQDQFEHAARPVLIEARSHGVRVA